MRRLLKPPARLTRLHDWPDEAQVAVAQRERVPLQWAMTETNLGFVLIDVGQRTRDPTPLEEAVTALEGAVPVFQSANSHYCQSAQHCLERAKYALSILQRKSAGTQSDSSQ